MGVLRVGFTNFRGQTAEYDLSEGITAIGGPNGAGKSTITKAIEVAIWGYVKGDQVDKGADGVFSAYCGEDDQKSTMECWIETGSGKLVRSFKRTPRGVRSELHLDGARISQSEDLTKRLGLPVFNCQEFWGMTPSQKLSKLCEMCGIDPERLDELDAAIAKKNGEKLLRDKDLQGARNALRDHEETLQGMSTPQGTELDLSNVDSRMEKLRKRGNDLSAEYAKAINAGAEQDRRTRRTAAIIEELEQLNAIHHEAPAQASGDPSEYAARAKAMEKRLDIEKERSALLKSLAEMRPPTPPAYGEKDIMRIDSEINALRYTGGEASELDVKIVDWAKGLTTEIRKMDGDEKTITDVRAIIKRRIGPHLEKVTASERKSGAAEQIVKLRTQKSSIQQLLRQYESDMEAYRSHKAAQEMVRKRMAEISAEMETLPEWDADELRSLQQEASAMMLADTEYRRWKAENESRQRRIVDLTEELEAVSAPMTDSPRDAESISQEIETVKGELEYLSSMHKVRTEYDYQHRITEEKRKEVRKLEGEVRQLRQEEEALIAEKGKMLEELRETIEERVSRWISPRSMTLEVSGGGRHTVLRFLIEHPGGRVAPREAASQAEQVELDIALAAALMEIAGTPGLIMSEVAEISSNRMVEFCAKAEKARGFNQVVMVGHNLVWYDTEGNAQPTTPVHTLVVGGQKQQRRSA